ncbi:hypothetical protein RHMOL_Rhmol02G0162800 [Rhododendron molle]|uniref:Uncharacterized protein n=1 Tax=Rhododendron molle TaxID=49168 RepID=A0ACC0PR59_RHOML|nr:hypothetical protein RHMOL_Rhmol02G0162800 [Rhododendron molle]
MSLAARVASLEAEIGFYHEEIKQINAQIARLISTIRTLYHAVSNLQDFTFDQQDDKYALEHLSEDTTEDSEGNSNGSDDRSDGAYDAFGEGSDRGRGRRKKKEKKKGAVGLFFFFCFFLNM